MTEREAKKYGKIIDSINQRLDHIEEMAAWLVSAEQRFKKGQRVQFSPAADRRGISARRKGGVRRGTVTGFGGFSVDVLLDGHKKPMGFHHLFFDPIKRTKR
jgi:hypothetical protein